MEVLEAVGFKWQLVRLEGERDALVVDADLLDVFEIVTDDHLLAADDRDAPHLAWVEPADVDVPDDVARERHVDERDVVHTGLNVGGAVRADADRVALQDVAEDGEVVRREIPDDVDVTVEEAQIEAGAVDVEDLAELTA